MSINNEEQKNNFITKKRKTNSLMNKYQFKNHKNDSRYLTVGNPEDKDYKTKTYNNKKINLSKSYSNFNNYNINTDNRISTENEIDFFKHPKLNFVPRINRHKRKENNEIAEILGISEVTVRTALCKARKNLLEKLRVKNEE